MPGKVPDLPAQYATFVTRSLSLAVPLKVVAVPESQPPSAGSENTSWGSSESTL